MRNLVCLALLASFLPPALPTAMAEETPANALDFTLENIEGEPVDLEKYKGKVVLMVNVASQCGLTPQYTGLQALYEKYQDKGLVVLGFPCNQFGLQEPGSNAEIKQFCTSKYDVTFPMFSKLEVNGSGAHPLYKYLTSQETDPKGAGKVSWNFEKFLVDRDGNLIGRYRPQTRPEEKELVSAIEAAL